MKVLILDKNTHRNRYWYLDSNEIHGRTPKPNGDGFLKVGSLKGGGQRIIMNFKTGAILSYHAIRDNFNRSKVEELLFD